MKKIPELKTEEEIVTFWDEHDSTVYIDWDKAKPMRLIKLQKSDISGQLYLKMFIANRLKAHG